LRAGGREMGEGAVLPMTRKLALGAGDFGFNLYWQTAGLYLLFFYTDGLGLPAAAAGLIYMGALIWDAALDPLVGLVADRTRTRLGRYRPYFLFGGVPLALAFAAMFLTPAASTTGAVLWAAAAHVAFRTCYAVVSIPYAALFARVTRDSAQRGDLAGVRMVFATLGAVVVAGLTLPMAKALGVPADPRRGWLIVGLAYGVVATLLILLVAWAARGLDPVEPAALPRPLGEVVRALAGNRALLIVLGAVLIGSFSGTFFGKNILYYFKYVVGRPELGGAALAVMALTAAACVPVWTWVLRLLGKRVTWLVGAWPTARRRRCCSPPWPYRRWGEPPTPSVSGRCCRTPSNTANGRAGCAPSPWSSA
jgi:GPH family glycoside/pentoside/hexuronide:cation symporter